MMKNLLFLISMQLIALPTLPQDSFRLEWEVQERAQSLNGIVDNKGNIVVVGLLRQTNKNYDMDAFIIKADTLGNYIYDTLAADAEDTSIYFQEVIELQNGNFLVTGCIGPTHTDSSIAQRRMISCIYNEDLELILRKEFHFDNTYQYTSYHKAIKESDGNILLATTAKRRTGPPVNIYDLGLFRFAPNGDTIETKFYHFQRNVSVFDFDKVPNSSNYMILEFITQLWGMFECFILKPNLEIETINYFDSYHYSIDCDITCDYWYPDNTFMMASSASMDNKKSDIGLGIFRCDTLANISDYLMLNKPNTYDRNAYHNCMAFADEQSIYIVGFAADFFNCQNPDSIELYVVDTALNQVAYKSLGGDISYDIGGVLTAKNGNAFIYGEAIDPEEHCLQDLVIYYINRKDLGLPPVKVFDYEPSNSASIVYPNPAKDIVNIRTDKKLLCNNSRIRLFNAASKKVYDYKLPKKGNTIQLNVSKLEKGIYLYSITSSETIIFNGKFVKN